jgi:Zn-dependent protease with chaperone function
MITILYALLYVSTPGDRKALKDFSLANREYFGELYHEDIFKKSFSENMVLKAIDSFSISPNQRLLTFIYSWMYVNSLGKVNKSEKIDKLREHLALDKSVSDYLHKSFPKPVLRDLLGDPATLESILEPSEKLSDSINRFMLRFAQNSSITKKQKLIGLVSKEYEHDYDRMALEKLSHMPGLEKVVKKFWEWGLEKYYKIQFTGSNIRVNDENYPELHTMLVDACEVLGISKIPDLYVNMGFLNAMTTGVNDPIIVISSGCVGLLTYDEMMFMLGHELGHIKSKHLLYQQLAMVLPYIASIVGNLTLGIGQLLGSGLQLALLDWMRKAEFSSDRAGLLVCQNIDAAVSTLMKLAGLPPRYYTNIKTETFLKQADEFEGFDTNEMDKIVKFLSVMGETHPWNVMRAKELNKWIKQGAYDRIMKKHKTRAGKLTAGKFCTACGEQLSKQQQFCTNCGEPCSQ